MTWFKADDKLAFHQKTVRAGNAAMGAWVRMGAWCGERESDGFIPKAIADLIASPDEMARLIEVGFMIDHTDGRYEMHDFLKYNPSHAELEAKRNAWAKKKAAFRAERESRAMSPGDTRGDTTGDSPKDSRESPGTGSGSGSGTGDQRSGAETNLPDQPVRLEDPLSPAERERVRRLSDRPAPPVAVAEQPARRRTKPEAGTTLPDGWEPSAEQTGHSWHQDALEKGFDARHVSDIVGAFKEYYTAGRGRNAKHVDWDRTWRNWLRKESPNRTAFGAKTGVRPMQQPALPGEYDWSIAARAKAKVV